MPSKALAMSSFDSMGCRTRRALTKASFSIAPWEAFSSEIFMFHSGWYSLTILFAIQEAKPSFSQISSHQAVVTRSPNH